MPKQMDYFKIISLLSSIVCINCAFIDDRLDCVIENKYFDENECKARDCIWSPVEGNESIPKCYFDKEKIGYNAFNIIQSDEGIEANLQLKITAKKSVNFEQIENLKFSVNYLTENILRFRITDPKNKRYEVPVQEQFPLLQKSPVEVDESKRQYLVDFSYETSNENFNFSIIRKESKTKIWDTSIGGLVFSDQFLQIASYLPSKNIYGFGENIHQTLRHDLNYKTWPLFTMGLPPENNEKNYYGVHPFYTCLENNGKSHGILFLNSNAMEYTLLPSPALSLKTTGGILDFFVFVGDNPEHVVQLYTSLIGRPVMPPFWGIGFQLTRYGYRNTEHVKKVIDRTVKQKIPMDVHYVDIDYMDQFKDFTYDPKNFAKLPELIAETKRYLNLHWTLMLDPAIQANDTTYDTFTKGYQQNVFIRWPKSIPIDERNNPTNAPNDKDVMYGRVWPRGPAAFPDFFKNATKDWWINRIDSLYKDLNLTFDALWIDMNEPYNFDDDEAFCSVKPCYYLKCPNSKYDEISARIKPVWVHNGNKRLSLNTLCMTAIQGDSDQYRHYDVHSLYGWSETEPTESAIHSVTGKRGFILTRSTYVGSNRHSAHWLGDNSSKWSHLRNSIIGMLEFSLFGFSWTGADICGFIGDVDPELCLRWSQLGAFYPFSRNHNEISATDQDPAVWVEKGHPEVTVAAKSSLERRYILLHYLYTLFFRAHTMGETVARPVFHEYPEDNNTHTIDEQFMWGRSILISPFLYPGQKQVNAYIPNDVWYVPTPEFVKLFPDTGYVKIPDPQVGCPTHIRGGSIIPIVVKPAVNTKIIRETPIQIEVYPKDRSANGDMFWDDGESVATIESGKYNYYEFVLHNCSLHIKVIKHGFDSQTPQMVDKVLIANTISGDIIAHIDGLSISSPVVKEDYMALPLNISLSSKTAGEKWVIDWKLKSNNECNLK